MFDMLIYCKNKVRIHCGGDDIVGFISCYYAPFRLVKINNVLLPIELIKQIEVLDEEPASAAIEKRHPLRDARRFHHIHVIDGERHLS
jgi:hypothetical protein